MWCVISAILSKREKNSSCRSIILKVIRSFKTKLAFALLCFALFCVCASPSVRDMKANWIKEPQRSLTKQTIAPFCFLKRLKLHKSKNVLTKSWAPIYCKGKCRQFKKHMQKCNIKKVKTNDKFFNFYMNDDDKKWMNYYENGCIIKKGLHWKNALMVYLCILVSVCKGTISDYGY